VLRSFAQDLSSAVKPNGVSFRGLVTAPLEGRRRNKAAMLGSATHANADCGRYECWWPAARRGQAAGPRRVVTSSRAPSSRASEWTKRDIIGESLTMNATKVINHYGNFIVTANIDGTMISAAYLIRWCSPSISPPRAI
jgi:hypothetical protein